jgi:nuclear receptor subfamily 6 group A
MTAPLSGLSQLQQHHQMHQVQIPFPPSATPIYKRNSVGQTSPNNNYSPPSSQAQQHSQQFLQHRIKRERSPTQMTIIQPNHRQPAQMSPHHIPISSAAAAVLHGSPIQMRAQNMREAAMLFRIKNEPQMQITPQMQGFMPHNPQQRMVWGPQARINGVKPEVIGGPLPPLRQQQSPQSSPQQTSPNQTPTNRTTPTVIMGESCGVRTMVWGFEPVMSSPPQAQVQTPTPPIQTPPSTSQNSNHSSSSNHSSNNEEAAHLLLSLGQGTRPMMDVS